MKRNSLIAKMLPCVALAGTLSAYERAQSLSSATLIGEAQDLTGSPVSAELIANRVLVRNGVVTFLPECHSETDKNGRFSCERLSPGKYLVEIEVAKAQHPKQVTCTAQSMSGLPPFMFYPDTTDFDEASFVTLKQEEIRNVQFVLEKTTLVAIQGHLSKQVTQSAVSLSAAAGKNLLDVGLDVKNDQLDGTFCAPMIPPGKYWLSLKGVLPGGAVVKSKQYFNSEIGPAMDISIDVQEPVAAEVTLQGLSEAESQGVLRLQRLDGSEADVLSQMKAGKAELLLQRNGHYALWLVSDQNLVMRSLSVNGVTEDPASFTVPDSGSVELEARIGGSGFSIQGHVTPDDASGHMVVIEAEDSGEIWTVPTDSTDHFLFKDVPPGEYRLYAWQMTAPVAYRDPDVRARYCNSSVEISIGPGSLPEEQVVESIEPLRDDTLY